MLRTATIAERPGKEGGLQRLVRTLMTVIQKQMVLRSVLGSHDGAYCAPSDSFSWATNYYKPACGWVALVETAFTKEAGLVLVHLVRQRDAWSIAELIDKPCRGK